MSPKSQTWWAHCRTCGREARVLHDPEQTFHCAPCPHCGIVSYFDLVREAKAPREASAPGGISAEVPGAASAAAGSEPESGGSPLATAIQKLRGKKSVKP